MVLDSSLIILRPVTVIMYNLIPYNSELVIYKSKSIKYTENVYNLFLLSGVHLVIIISQEDKTYKSDYFLHNR